jgi:hypothetical protein
MKRSWLKLAPAICALMWSLAFEASAQRTGQGAVGFYQACIARPTIDRPLIERAVIERAEISRAIIERPLIDRPDIMRPVIERPEIARPVLERPEFDTRCDQYVATSLLPGGLRLDYSKPPGTAGLTGAAQDFLKQLAAIRSGGVRYAVNDAGVIRPLADSGCPCAPPMPTRQAAVRAAFATR